MSLLPASCFFSSICLTAALVVWLKHKSAHTASLLKNCLWLHDRSQPLRVACVFRSCPSPVLQLHLFLFPSWRFCSGYKGLFPISLRHQGFFPLSGLESHYLPSLEWPSDALPWTKPWPFFTVARADVYFVTFFWGVSSFACYSAGDAQIRWGRVRSSSTWQLKPLIQLCHFLAVWLWVRSSLDSATVSSSVNRDENTAHVLRFLKEIVLVKCLAQCLACRKCSINT